MWMKACTVSECQCYLSHDIKLTNKVQEPLEFNCNGVLCRSGPGCRNATDVLMSSAQTLHLPKEIDSSANNRDDVRLYNDIICFMSNRSLGFHAGTEQTSGKQI